MTQTHPDPHLADRAMPLPAAPWTTGRHSAPWDGSPGQPNIPGWPAYGAPAPQRSSGMRWGWIVLGVVAAIVAVAIIGTVAQKTAKMTINGSVVAYGTGTLTPGSGCSMTSMEGKSVSIFGSKGDLVGTTTLSGDNGVAVNQWNTYSYANYADGCRFAFTLTNVTSADDFYTVAVGSNPALGVGFSKDQLQSSGAQITYGHS